MNCPFANVSAIARNRTRYIELSCLLVGSVILWWQPLVSTLTLALGSDAYTYLLLILPLSGAMIYFETKENRGIPQRKRWIGAVLLSIALLLLSLTVWNILHLSSSESLSLSMFALLIWWIGSVIGCFGLPYFRSLLFPLCFLFLIVPLPAQALNWATGFLQHQSAVAADFLFRAAWVPVTRNGVILSIPGLDVEVARECSSIRSSEMLVVITMILAQLLLQSWWTKTVLILAAIPLAVLKNAVRIFTVAELGTRVDPGYLDGRLHHQGGIIFLALALVVEIPMLLVLRKAELRRNTFSPD